MEDELETRDENNVQAEQLTRRSGCGKILLALAAIVLVVWLIQPVETGVGEMRRVKVARVFLHLAFVEKPSGFDPLSEACLKVYGNHVYEGAVRAALLPSYGLALINGWLIVLVDGGDGNKNKLSLAEVWDMIDDVYHDQVRELVSSDPVPPGGDTCHLPKALTWTDVLLP